MPRGSLIERLETGVYRICDRDHHCREVQGLWQARELVRELELQQQLFQPCTIAGEE
ncbi:hypothetical protein [Synechococcus sp. RS9907]|uniref:hypothetical protein n=1 Tax=Synechococcus sp. RS9907 TaxID=221350 RepID=UPI002105DFFD|nr:hypothetical protein [Synechococcus sp. RS9907]